MVTTGPYDDCQDYITERVASFLGIDLAALDPDGTGEEGGMYLGGVMSDLTLGCPVSLELRINGLFHLPGTPFVSYFFRQLYSQTSNYCLKNRALGFPGTYKWFVYLGVFHSLILI